MRPKTIVLSGLEFWLVGSPEIQRTAQGQLVEYSHPIPDGQRPNLYAAGPFCRFGLPAAPNAAGVYAIFVNEELKYIGRCEDLASRFGPRGYGLISPRNIHNDGQSTKCKLNSCVLVAAKEGRLTQVWFHSTPDFVAVEQLLIEALKPEWNGRNATGIGPTSALRTSRRAPNDGEAPGGDGATAPVRYDFDRELRTLLTDASGKGLELIEISAGQLHKLVGGYPGKSHRMPVCCARMRAAMRAGDRITYAPPKGNGARLNIEYRLPR